MKKHDDQAKGKIEELAKPHEDWKSKYLRALADYQNLEKRSFSEKEQVRQFAAETLLKRLLPVVDTFERAQIHLQDKGLALALREMFAVLREHGVEKLTVVGKEFNPHEMECIEVVAGEENKVVEEILPGYKLRGKVLRVAQVKVGKREINKRAEELAKPELQKGDYM